MGWIIRKCGITNNLRFSSYRRSNYRRNRQRKLCRWCKQTCPCYEIWPHPCVLLQNQHFQDEGAGTVPKVKACDDNICLRTVVMMFGNETWVLEESSSGPWLFTHLKHVIDFTGSHDRISSNKSSVNRVSAWTSSISIWNVLKISLTECLAVNRSSTSTWNLSEVSTRRLPEYS